MVPHRGHRLSTSDKAILKAVEGVVDGIAAAFGSDCEVVLHSMQDVSHSVVKIVNSQVSGRHVGSPLTDRALEIVGHADSIDSDIVRGHNVEIDGKPVKSTGILIRNAQQQVIGILCINFDLAAPAFRFFQHLFGSTPALDPEAKEDFAESIDDLVRRAMEKARTAASAHNHGTLRALRHSMVAELHQRGIFEVSGAVDVVAQELGVSRYTVYNYIREAKLASRPSRRDGNQTSSVKSITGGGGDVHAGMR